MLAFALERKNHLIGCVWFWAWAAIGAGSAVGFISFLGVLTLVPTLLVGFVLSRRHPVNWFGLVSGIGVMLLVIAYLQRQGPGTTCTRTATSVSCEQHLNPIPWLVVGLLFLAVGLVGHARRSART
jgi:hypothetical protein